MKAIQSNLMAGLLLVSVLGTTGSAQALPVKIKKAATTVEKPSSPEIVSAETRVEQAKAQVEVAMKQLNASKSLVRAAQADLKAAETNLSALQIKAEAQGLVDETGMTPAKAAPVSIASKTKEESQTEEDKAPASNQDTRIRAVDFNGAQPSAAQ